MSGERAGSWTRTAREARASVGDWLPYFLLTAAFYVSVALVGAIVGDERRSSLVPVRSPGEPLPPLDPLSLFLEDVQVAALLIVGAIFVLPTIALLAYNAVLFGATTASAVGALGPVATLSIVLPHAVFELPAIWLAGAIALHWLHVAWQVVRDDDRRVSVDRTVRETVAAILVVVVLLAVAAVVEGTITKALVQSLT